MAYAMCFTIWLMLLDGMRFHKVRTIFVFWSDPPEYAQRPDR